MAQMPRHHVEFLSDRLKVLTSGVTAVGIQLRQLRVLMKVSLYVCCVIPVVVILPVIDSRMLWIAM